MIFGSVCSGIEAASVAWHPLGWRAAFLSEIEKFPSAVLRHHYPDVPNLGDMRKFEDWPDARIDVLVGGTPCQDFSVAGLRKGLDGERGILMLVYAQIARRYRAPRILWENVPGVLSSNGGRDFASLLGILSGRRIEVPNGGWRTAGVVPGLGSAYGLAWRVLDAQYVRVDGFGRAVPQRRRRVFVVGYLGDWRRAAAVLFERSSLSGNPAPRREAWKSFTYDVAPCLTSSGRGVERPGETRGQDPVVAVQGVALRGREGGATAELTGDVMTALRTGGGGGDKPHVLLPLAFGGNNQSGPIDVATTQTAHAGRLDFESETFVCFDETQITSAENRCNPQPGDPYHPLARGARPPTLAFSTKDYGNDCVEELAPTMRAIGHSGSHQNAGGQLGIVQGWRVRRLTPMECERLQGFPDGYTAVPYRNKPSAADGPRHKALGNSMAVNVMRWIARRMELVEFLSMRDAA